MHAPICPVIPNHPVTPKEAPSVPIAGTHPLSAWHPRVHFLSWSHLSWVFPVCGAHAVSSVCGVSHSAGHPQGPSLRWRVSQACSSPWLGHVPAWSGLHCVHLGLRGLPLLTDCCELCLWCLGTQAHRNIFESALSPPGCLPGSALAGSCADWLVPAAWPHDPVVNSSATELPGCPLGTAGC